MARQYGPYLKWIFHYNKTENVVFFVYTTNWKVGYESTVLKERVKSHMKLLEAIDMDVNFWYREDLSNGDVIIHWNITRR